MDIFRPNKNEVLSCGEYLVDDKMEFCDEELFSCIRIMVIKYINNLYFCKMIDGEVVKFRRLE